MFTYLFTTSTEVYQINMLCLHKGCVVGRMKYCNAGLISDPDTQKITTWESHNLWPFPRVKKGSDWKSATTDVIADEAKFEMYEYALFSSFHLRLVIISAHQHQVASISRHKASAFPHTQIEAYYLSSQLNNLR